MSLETTASVWSLGRSDTLQALETDESGLTEEEALKRKRQLGSNTLQTKKPVRAFGIFLKQFASPLIFILLGASLLTAVLGEFVDTGIILLAVLVNVVLGFYQEYRAEHTLEKLATYIKERAIVVRDGIEAEVDPIDIVPGDIIRLSYGSRVPADARIIFENGLAIDEAILTGESLDVDKTTDVLSEGTPLPERKNMAFAGTMVTEGFGTAVVSHTGKNTELGRIATLVSDTKQEKTPLQKGIGKLAWIILVGVTVVIVGVFFLGVSRGEPVLEMLLIAAAVAVGAIPEALPIALTVILAVGAERIARVRGIIRSLAAAETLGSASIVMTDKTGTLTKADMKLTETVALADMNGEARSAHIDHQLITYALHATSVTVVNPKDATSEWRFVGRAMETGIARAAQLLEDTPLTSFFNSHTPPILPFNSSIKFSVSHYEADDAYIVMGAPDILLARSDISKDTFITAESWLQDTSSEGKRLLGIALIPKKKLKNPTDPESITNLTYLGTLVFQDPVREEAPLAVARIQSLGVRVIMVTGDLKGTALSVARELGWEVDAGSAMTGDEIRSLSDAELLNVLSHTNVFARMTPEDKLRIGKLLQSQGEVVAMTGDGVNDAPALKSVDIGVALGSGSDVAKSAADLVLLDDNFKTIVSAIEEGRRMIANIRKSFVYLMSNSLDEVILIGGSLLVGLPLPLTALQIIWVNFFTGSWPALSYAFDDANGELGRPEKKRAGVIFNREVKILTVGIGVLTSLLLFALYWTLMQSGISAEEARTMVFICFAAYILVVAFSLRSLTRPLFSYPIFSNKLLTASVVIALIVLVITATTPPLQAIFGLVSLPLMLWGGVVLWLIFNIALVEAAKWLFRTHYPTAKALVQ